MLCYKGKCLYMPYFTLDVYILSILIQLFTLRFCFQSTLMMKYYLSSCSVCLSVCIVACLALALTLSIYIHSMHIYIYIYISVLIEINECESSPCLNGASCVDNINRYSCSCLVGYTDPECSTGAVVFFSMRGQYKNT